MKNKILAIVMVIFLLVVFFIGCLGEDKSKQEKDQIEELITAPLTSLLLKIEDLPEGYSVNYSGSEHITEFPISSNETYAILFLKENISDPDEYDLIKCELNKFNSIEEAEIAFNITVENMLTIRGFEVIDGSIDVIGTESIGITSPVFDHLFSFRISNIICVMSSTDYSLTIDLAKIVEKRIYDSLD